MNDKIPVNPSVELYSFYKWFLSAPVSASQRAVALGTPSSRTLPERDVLSKIHLNDNEGQGLPVVGGRGGGGGGKTGQVSANRKQRNTSPLSIFGPPQVSLSSIYLTHLYYFLQKKWSSGHVTCSSPRPAGRLQDCHAPCVWRVLLGVGLFTLPLTPPFTTRTSPQTLVPFHILRPGSTLFK